MHSEVNGCYTCNVHEVPLGGTPPVCATCNTRLANERFGPVVGSLPRMPSPDIDVSDIGEDIELY